MRRSTTPVTHVTHTVHSFMFHSLVLCYHSFRATLQILVIGDCDSTQRGPQFRPRMSTKLTPKQQELTVCVLLTRYVDSPCLTLECPFAGQIGECHKPPSRRCAASFLCAGGPTETDFCDFYEKAMKRVRACPLLFGRRTRPFAHLQAPRPPFVSMTSQSW